MAAYLRARLDAGLRADRLLHRAVRGGLPRPGRRGRGRALQTGRFTHGPTRVYVWGILAGAGVGLLASTLGRLYSSTFYALRDTRTPLRFAVVRVALTTGLGYIAAIRLPGWIGIEPRWGVAGLTASAGIAGWVEFCLLRRTSTSAIGPTGLPASFTARLSAAAAAGAAAVMVRQATPLRVRHPVVGGALILAPYGLVYFGSAWLLRVPEAKTVVFRDLRAAGMKRR